MKRQDCGGDLVMLRTWGDLDTCVAREKLVCVIGANAPSTGATPAVIEACVAALPDADCGAFLDGAVPTSCVFIGKKTDFASCAVGAQCASTYCLGTRTSACGTCGPAPKPLDSCTETSCARGQLCVPQTAMCEQWGALGDPCGSEVPCGSHLACQGSTATTPGACTPGGMLGDACGGALPGCDLTDSFVCALGASGRVCQNVVYVGDGQPCGAVPQSPAVSCQASGGCYTAAGITQAAQMGTCKLPVTEGMPCDSELGPSCEVPARCIATGNGTAGTCQLADPSACE